MPSAERAGGREGSAARLEALGGACLAVVGFAVLDAALVMVRDDRLLDPGPAARVFALCVLATVSAGAIAAIIVALGVARLGRPRRARGLAGGLVLLAVAGLVLDKWAFVHRYPYFHTLLAVGYTGAAALAGSVAALERLSRRTAGVGVVVGLVAALAGALAGPALFGRSQVVRAMVPEHSTWGRVIGGLWAPPVEPPGGPEPAAGACTFPPAQPVPAAADPLTPGASVLWLSIDAVRGDLGGPSLATTWPRLSAALPGAFRFDGAHAPGTRTTESVYGMLTGRWPHELSFRPTVADEHDQFRVLDDDDPRVLDPGSWRQHHPLPVLDEHPSVAAVLGRAGYRTGAVAVSLFMLPGTGVTRGFDEVDTETYRKLRAKELPGESFSAPTVADRLIAFIDAAPDDPRPFFAWAHLLDPHIPYEVTDPALADAPAPERYLAEIRRTEAEVARVVEHLRATGRLERTIVIVTSDHGEEFRDHGGLLHGTTVYQELLHVPLLLWVPGLEGRVVPERVSLVDLVPTLVELLGVTTGVPWSGRSLVPLLRGQPWSPRPLLGVSTLHETRTAIIDGDDKLIEHDTGAVELYDLAADPTERRNLADARPSVVERLQCMLRAAGAR